MQICIGVKLIYTSKHIPLMTSQHFLKNPMLKPFGPRIFSPLQNQTTSLISSRDKCTSRLKLFASEYCLNITPIQPWSMKLKLLKLVLKLLWTSNLIYSTCVINIISRYMATIPFPLYLLFIVEWNNFEFKSPSQSHLHLDFCLSIASLCCKLYQTLL